MAPSSADKKKVELKEQHDTQQDNNYKEENLPYTVLVDYVAAVHLEKYSLKI